MYIIYIYISSSRDMCIGREKYRLWLFFFSYHYYLYTFFFTTFFLSRLGCIIIFSLPLHQPQPFDAIGFPLLSSYDYITGILHIVGIPPGRSIEERYVYRYLLYCFTQRVMVQYYYCINFGHYYYYDSIVCAESTRNLLYTIVYGSRSPSGW